MTIRSREERERALLEEVKTILQEKGKELDPEMLARLTTGQGGVIEGRESRFAEFWRGFRVMALLLLIGFFAVIFFLISGSPERSGHPPAGVAAGRPGSEVSR